MQLQTFVGRRDALSTLQSLYQEASSGAPQIAVIEGLEGSGRRSLVSHALTTASTSPLVLRAVFSEGEDGLKVLLRLYAVLFASLHDTPEICESVRAHVDALLLEATEPRKQWLTAFREGMDKDRPDVSSSSFQVTIPRQSPYLALQEILATVAPQHPVVLELGEIDHVLSFAFWSFLTALMDRARFQKLPLFFVLWSNRIDPAEREALPFAPRLALLEGLPEELPVTRLQLDPLSDDEIAEALQGHYSFNRFPPALAQKLAALSAGLPGRLAQLLERMEETGLLTRADDDSWLFTGEASDLDLDQLVPTLQVENADQARRMLQVAALEGSLFTARIISDQLAIEKDTVDDMLDELEDVIEEVVFHEGLQTWLYRFRSPLVHRYFASMLEAPARKELALSLSRLLERTYMGRSVEYAIKAARLYKEAGEPRRSISLIGLAASAERPDLLQMGAEIVKSFPQTRFPAPLFKGLHLTLLEKVSTTGPVEPLMQIVQDVDVWAKERNDEEVLPWLSFYRARLLHRSGKLKEAHDEAVSAGKGFARQENPVKEADTLNVLALISLAQGEPGVAYEHTARALKKSDFPPVRAQALFIRGLIQRARGELQEALNTLKEALDLAGQTGNLPVHLDAGITIAEILLMGGKAPDAAQLLKQLVEVARQTKQLPRERAAISLMSKVQASLKDFQQAIEFGSQSLKLSRDMKLRPFEAADLLDLGIFSLVRGQADEAAVYLRESEKIARDLKDPRLLKEILFHLAMVSTQAKEHAKALNLYQEALKLAHDAKDERREANILFNIGGIYLFQEEFARARTALDQAAPLIEKSGSPEEKKALQKARDQLELKLN